MSCDVISTLYSSSTTCASSTRSSESTSSCSQVASRLTTSASAPKVTSAARTRASTCSAVTVADMYRSPVCGVGSGGEPAVDDERGSGDVAGLFGGQEADAGRDLFGRAGAPHGDALGHRLEQPLGH